MEQAQIKYMLDNGISEADCNSCTKSIVGTIKSYSKHLIVCSGDSSRWISHIAEAGHHDNSSMEKRSHHITLILLHSST
jgi:hypothetical protein